MSKVQKIAQRGLDDYYFFAREIVGLKKMVPDPHQDLCAHIVKPDKNKKLTLMPRNSYKSSVVTTAGTMWFLLRDPNERILIASESQRNAIKYVNEIKSHYEGNERFRALYGDWANEGQGWRSGEITIKPRTAFKKEPSITAGSLEKGIMTGMHHSTIILDDVVSGNNTQTAEQIEKTLRFYKVLLSILDPDGRLLINGTRWSFLDLYGHILENERDQFDIFIRKADNGLGSEIGNSLMPSVLSRDFLHTQLVAQGLSVYSHQYRNEALSSDEQSFKPEYVKFYDESPGGLYYFLSIDPAIATSSDSDFTGIIVNGVDNKEHWWIQEAVCERLTPSEIMERIFEFSQRYKPLMAIGIEGYMLERLLKVNLQKEMLDRGISIPIKEVATDNRKSKEYRIRGLQPVFEAGRIHLKRTHQALYQQIISFPQVRHDDVLDALKTQLAITFPSDLQSQPAPDEKKSGLTLRETEIWEKVEELGRRRVHASSDYEY